MDPVASPPPCPTTVRRNPPRRARPTPSAATSSLPLSLSPPQDLNPKPDSSPDTLKVFLRIKPQLVSRKYAKPPPEYKNAWPRRTRPKANTVRGKANTVRGKGETCVSVNDGHSVTLCPPKGLQEGKRAKTEVFEGFSHVFSAHSSQVEVFDIMVKPLVDDFLSGRSGTLVALGPSGSGKTHTVFGSPREPGMVPLALNRIFTVDEMNHNQSSRTFYLSMYEISERGKSEKLCDLLQDGGDLSFQQSAIRGLQEVHISDIQQAECLIARALLKRATAMTGSNSQSSRSQCVINIRTNKIDEEADVELNSAVLTIVDLAGAERERKTGNQGARLLESNFINTTSMVFGLCLRSLLEHQKNPKRPLQKHFQNSLLTRILREYLEGKKRMALILTVKSGEEDYVDSSLLLRQASPYTKIKFENAEEPVNLLCTKRHKQAMPRIEPSKRMKFSPEERVNNDGKGVGDQLPEEESQIAKKIAPKLPVVHAESTIGLGTNECDYRGEASTGSAKQERNYTIMQNFAKALWNVLKQYKTNLEVAENNILNLTESLAYEKARRSELEIELKDLQGTLSYRKVSSDKEDSANKHAEQVGYQGQIYQVAENKIQNLTDNLANEEAGSFKLEIDLNLKGSLSCGEEISSAKEDSISADKSEEEVGYQEQSGQVAENQMDHLSDVLADEGATHSELELNRSCLIENSPVKEDTFSVNINGEQVGSQQTDNVPDSNLCNASSLAVVNSKSQGQGHQSNDQDCVKFPAYVDCTEALTEPTDVEKADTHFNDLGNQKPLVSFPELITIAKESSPEPLVRTKKNSCHSTESKLTRCEEYKERSRWSRNLSKAKAHPDSDVNNIPKIEKKSKPCKPSNAEKPKRRLAPASSILLKDLGGLSFEDENEKPKGIKGDKKSGPNERNITQGSLSLLRLLNTNLHL